MVGEEMNYSFTKNTGGNRFLGIQGNLLTLLDFDVMNNESKSAQQLVKRSLLSLSWQL